MCLKVSTTLPCVFWNGSKIVEKLLEFFILKADFGTEKTYLNACM